MINVNINKTLKNHIFNYNIVTSSNKIALFGPSGSGKTTFLKLIAGLNTPDYGHININGKIFFDKKVVTPIHKRKIGYIPQDYTLFPHMNIKKNILYGVKAQKIKYFKEKFDFLIDKLKINKTLSFYPHEISGGERQRAAIARSFLINPSVLLLDEPFSALDKTLLDLVQELLEYAEFPTILVTHDLNEALNFGETIAILYNGSIIEYNKPENILNNPEWLQTAQVLQIKNIWHFNKIKKLLPVDYSKKDFEYVAIKEEDLIISPKSKIKCKILNIKKNRYNFTINALLSETIPITISSPISTVRYFNLSKGNFINIYFNIHDLIYLKDYEKSIN